MKILYDKIKDKINFGKEGKTLFNYLLNEDLLNKNISNHFYDDISGVFALYDVTKIKSFEKTLKIIEDIKEKIGNVVPFLLVGNKTDLQNLKVVNLEDVKNKTKNNKRF